MVKYSRDSGYTLTHYKRVLVRFVSHFDPPLRPITENMEATKMATFLSNLTLHNKEFEIFETQIHKLVRSPGQKIKAVMSHLHAVVKELKHGTITGIDCIMLWLSIMLHVSLQSCKIALSDTLFGFLLCYNQRNG
jgi:hypothetical protein